MCDGYLNIFILLWKLTIPSFSIGQWGVINCSTCCTFLSFMALKWICVWCDVSYSFTYVMKTINLQYLFEINCCPMRLAMTMCQLTWLPEPRINRGDPSGLMIKLNYSSTWGQWNILPDFKWPSLTRRGLYTPINWPFHSDMAAFRQGTRSPYWHVWIPKC